MILGRSKSNGVATAPDTATAITARKGVKRIVGFDLARNDCEGLGGRLRVVDTHTL
jgi:hypothetical protein